MQKYQFNNQLKKAAPEMAAAFLSHEYFKMV